MVEEFQAVMGTNRLKIFKLQIRITNQRTETNEQTRLHTATKPDCLWVGPEDQRIEVRNFSVEMFAVEISQILWNGYEIVPMKEFVCATKNISLLTSD